MAKITQDITKPFSRLKNGLVELQRWWPAYVKNDGVGGLTVDPVLYHTNFGPLTNADEGALNSENNTPGVRVEAIKDDGTAAANDAGTNTAFTVTISGAGTFSPMCVVSQAGVETKFMLIAPSPDYETKTESTYGETVNADDKGHGGASTWLDSKGPYPVFMTVQEFAEMLDTYRHIGSNDGHKKAFLPHAMLGGGALGLGASSALPQIQNDPRVTSSINWPADGSTASITQSLIRATVFMPMMLDNNQFDKRITGASISHSTPRDYGTTQPNFVGYLTADGTGITRYDSDPQGSDASTIRYKDLGYSGDHLEGKVGGWSYFRNAISHGTGDPVKSGYSSPDVTADSSPSLAPKYRMRMALACFLKNGTYDITDGNIIPYVYDADRTIGGKNTMTLYQVWNGLDGKGESTNIRYDCDAQIYPMFDFVQGPVCPAAQGSNGHNSVLAEAKSWPNLEVWDSGAAKSQTSKPNPKMQIVRPNPRRSRVVGVKFTTAGQIQLYVQGGTFGTDEFQCGEGMPVYLTGITGLLGTGNTNPDFRLDGYQEDAASSTTINASKASSFDINGWWMTAGFVTGFSELVTSTFDEIFGDGDGTSLKYQKILIKTLVNLRPNSEVFYRIGSVAETSTAYICQGRQSGYIDNIGTAGIRPRDGSLSLSSGVYKVRYEGVGSHGMGFSSDTNTPQNKNDTYPGRPTVRNAAYPDSSGHFNNDTKLIPRSIGPRKDGDDEFSMSPTVSSFGGGSLRVPPPVGWDLPMAYFSWPILGAEPTGTTNPGSETVSRTSRYWLNDTTGSAVARNVVENFGAFSKWAHRGLSVPMLSYMDSTTGRHAWDYIKPVSSSGTWLHGRNRPWPAQERLGTRFGYGPSLLETAKLTETNGDNYDGWQNYDANGGNRIEAGAETTKIGVSEIGCSPVWLDMEMRAFVPVTENRMTLIEFDNGVSYPVTGRHSMMTGGIGNAAQFGLGFYPKSSDGSKQFYSANAPETQLLGQNYNSVNSTPGIQTRRPTFTLGRPAVYIWGTASHFEKNDLDAVWTNSDAWPFGSSKLGWGGMGNDVGYGTGLQLSEGTQTIRTVFNEGGMQLLVNGSNKGTDTNSGQMIWGMTIKACDAMSSEGAINTPTIVKNNNNELITNSSPNLAVSSKDLQIDYLTLRQIPSPAMLPFNVSTTTQSVTNAAKYRSLDITAENISTSRGMNIKVSLYEPPTATGIPQAEPTTLITGFDNLDAGFIAGIGSIDLTNLPASAITNGFVIKYHFYIPDSSQTSLHPIDWNAIPIIRDWKINYDLKPTVNLACIGNSFSGDISTPIGTEVGHIISLRATGITTDEDRLISSVKFDFGDGSQTGWLDFTDQTLQTNTYDIAHVYSKAGTFSAVAYSKDDNGNESVASSIISVVCAEVNPVALLRAIPSMVRAGQAVNFDASESYVLSTDTARTIASYTFDFGDGSSVVSGASPNAAHTYAIAGEFMATVTTTDNASPTNTSVAAKVAVKILPATLVIPFVLNTKPKSFNRTRKANYATTSVLDAVYPEMSDMGSRTDTFKMAGSFLKSTANADIDFVEEILVSGALVEYEYEETDYSGSTVNKMFVGRLTDFNYQREGGKHGETPWTATLTREAGLGN